MGRNQRLRFCNKFLRRINENKPNKQPTAIPQNKFMPDHIHLQYSSPSAIKSTVAPNN